MLNVGELNEGFVLAVGEEYTLSGNQSNCDKSSASKVEIASILEKSILSAKPSSITHPGVYGSVANGC